MRQQTAPQSDERGWHATLYILTLIFLALLIAALFLTARLWTAANTTASVLGGCPVGTPNTSCNDYNPCTLDLQLETSCDASSNTTCATIGCAALPMADGSCCNAEDVCYVSNPLKTCSSGQCVSPNVTDCKAYCVADEDCDPALYPLNGNLTTTNLVCLMNSCIRLIALPMPTNSTAVLLNQSDPNALAQAYCFSGVYGTGDDIQYDAAWAVFLYYHCAPFVFEETKKRDDPIATGATAPPQHVYKFAYPFVHTKEQFDAVDSRVQAHSHAMLSKAVADGHLSAVRVTRAATVGGAALRTAATAA